MKSVSENQFYHSFASSQLTQTSNNCMNSYVQSAAPTYSETYPTPKQSFVNPVFYNAQDIDPATPKHPDESFALKFTGPTGAASTDESSLKNSNRKSKKQKNASKKSLLIKQNITTVKPAVFCRFLSTEILATKNKF